MTALLAEIHIKPFYTYSRATTGGGAVVSRPSALRDSGIDREFYDKHLRGEGK